MTVSRHSTAVSETRRLWDTGWCAVSPLFTDVVQCLGTPLLEIKKSESCDWYWHVCMRLLSIPAVVYLFLVCYGRQKADQLHLVIPSFLQVCLAHDMTASENC